MKAEWRNLSLTLNPILATPASRFLRISSSMKHPKTATRCSRINRSRVGPGNTEERTFQNRILPVNLNIQKFYDSNKNGAMDQGEDDGSKYPLDGWRYNVTYQGNTETYTTNADGIVSISLPGVAKETVCTITEILDRPGWICTTTNAQRITISCKNPAPLVKFGNKVNRINLTKFNDSNNNGQWDRGEDGLPGWSFVLEGPDGRAINTKPTDINGVATEEGLAPGR